MSVLFNHACRYELFDRNPIRFVRQRAKRRTAPTLLAPIESGPWSCLQASTVLRQGELFRFEMGRYFDFAASVMNVTRSVVYGVVGSCKTESSQKPVPLHPLLAESLAQWRERSVNRKSEDWVFPSRRYRGRKPCWGHAILRRYIRPAAKNQGIEKRIGWHTFRRTYATLLKSVGTEFKVMQELMRHSSLRSTLDIYAQAITPAKHAAQAAVVSLMFPPGSSSAAVSDSAENPT